MTKLCIIKTGETFDDIKAKRNDFEDWILAKIGIEKSQVNIVTVFRGEKLVRYGNIKGIIITGSHSSVTEKLSWSEYTAEWLLEAIEQSIPILGICYGHQLLAHALGGKVILNPNGLEFGTVDVKLKEDTKNDYLFKNIPQLFKAHATHEDTVITLPPKAKGLAYSPIDTNQAFSYKDHVWGVQFHPEFNADITIQYIKKRIDSLENEGKDPKTIIKNCCETPDAESLLLRFYQLIK